MHRYSRFAGAAMMFFVSVHAMAGALAPKSLYAGRVNLLLPEDFRPMSREELLKKYTRPSPPNLVYANDGATVSVVIEHTAVALKPSELELAFKQLKIEFEKIAQPTDWYRSEVTTINGRRYFLMDVRTPAADGKVRNLMIGTSVDDRLLMISFNTTQALEEQWMPIAHRIIQSVSVK